MLIFKQETVVEINLYVYICTVKTNDMDRNLLIELLEDG